MIVLSKLTMDEEELLHREKWIGLVGLALLSVFSLLDIYEGLEDGSTAGHIAIEVVLLALYVSAGVYLWVRVRRAMMVRLSALKQVANSARADLETFKNQNQALAAGITKAVDSQLEAWGLSSAERDVAYFLIKGLSFKEISMARKTSEHTVRQQAATIYKKSGLDGRAQLSAFFLEDLFTPQVG